MKTKNTIFYVFGKTKKQSKICFLYIGFNENFEIIREKYT
jgi:hypothetical protein